MVRQATRCMVECSNWYYLLHQSLLEIDWWMWYHVLSTLRAMPATPDNPSPPHPLAEAELSREAADTRRSATVHQQVNYLADKPRGGSTFSVLTNGRQRKEEHCSGNKDRLISILCCVDTRTCWDFRLVYSSMVANCNWWINFSWHMTRYYKKKG